MAAALKMQIHPPFSKGSKGVVAANLQGLCAADVKSTVERESNKSKEWGEAYTAGGLGGFVSYGVGSQSAPWVASKLVSFDWEIPASLDDVAEGDTATDGAVEAVRVRVWESEPACLPFEAGEKILTVRKRLRRFRNRVELCVKILSGLEGKGRRTTPAALEKAKVMLEKADQMHFKEEQRLKAVEEREREKEKERERKEQEKEKERERKGKIREEKKLQKAKESKKKSWMEKRRKQESAQAMFMMRFVKQKTLPAKRATSCDRDSLVPDDTPDNITFQVEENTGALKMASDKDVMSIAWWLLSVMGAPAWDDLDRSLRAAANSANSSQPSMGANIHCHLVECAKRREAAEGTLDKVLLGFHRKRKQHLDDRAPRFARRRADIRGRCKAQPIKLLQFEDDHRPPFFGTDSRKSKFVGPRRPFEKDTALDYSYDSAEEWEDDEDGEDILDEEAENERANEDAELRILYGSDEEDDDDFLDDEDVEDDDGEDEESDDGDADDALRGDGAGKDAQRSSAAVNLTDAIPGSGKKKVRGPHMENAEGPKRKKRRRNSVKQSVVVQGVSIPAAGVASPLDCYPVTVLEGAPRIVMFNPYVTHVSNYLQETSPPKPVTIRIPRTSLDEGSKLDLAVAIMTTKERTSRDAIVYQFCERRRSLGLPVPPKIEVVRAMRVLAANEKRNGDTRAGWYLNDERLEAKVRAMNLESVNAQLSWPYSEALGCDVVAGSAAANCAVGERIVTRVAIDAAKRMRVENASVGCGGEGCGAVAAGAALSAVPVACADRLVCESFRNEARDVAEASSPTTDEKRS